MIGKLFIVATPIGNLEDITIRALKVLKEVDVIVCEDTRRTGILLKKYNINKILISYHQHSRLKKIDKIIDILKNKKNVALVTDAGTPGIADPAGILIDRVLRFNIEVEPVPGPSVLTTFLSVSGLNTDRFLFLGYLPKKKGRKSYFVLINQSNFPIVIFESPYRIIKTLTELDEVVGDREVVVGRELTKKFQEILRGKIKDIIRQIRPQGEFIILISGK